MKIKTTLVAVCSTALLLQLPCAMAQDASPSPAASPAATTPPAPGGPGGGPGGGQGGFQQRMNDRLKALLKASDDEWAVIQPLLEKVQTAQRATMQGRLGGFGGGRRGGGGGQGGGNNPSTAPAGGGGGGGGGQGGPGGGRFGRVSSPEADALQAALASDSTPDSEIQTKLQALRDARKKAQANLEAARQDLEKVLTLRQEATLVQMGLLE